jgi:hypothetical protein
VPKNMRGGSFGGRAEASQEANAKAHRIEFTPRAGHFLVCAPQKVAMETGLPENPGAEGCGADCRRARSGRATHARTGVAPGGDCICRAYRRPIIRSH